MSEAEEETVVVDALPDDRHRVTMLVGKIAADSATRGETQDQYRARVVAVHRHLGQMIEAAADQRHRGDGRSPDVVAVQDLAATENAVGVLRVLQQAGYDQLTRTVPGSHAHVSVDWLVECLHRARRGS